MTSRHPVRRALSVVAALLLCAGCGTDKRAALEGSPGIADSAASAAAVMPAGKASGPGAK